MNRQRLKIHLLTSVVLLLNAKAQRRKEKHYILICLETK